MDSFGPPQALYYIGYALQCLAYLAGIVAGVVAITRKRTLPGILAAAAFFLLGLDLLIRFITWNFLVNVFYDYGTLNWVSYCLSTPMILIGIIALVVSVFMSVGKKETLPLPPGIEDTPPEA